MNGDEKFQSSPKAMTVTGRDNDIIGMVRNSDVDEGGEGMIVLFSHPPSEAGVAVILEKFEVRESQKNPGKKYVKCFQWITLEDFERIRDAERTGELEIIRQEQFQKLAEVGVVVDLEIATKLIEADQNEVFASLLIKNGAKAVFWDRWNFLVITDGESINVPIVDAVDSLDVYQSNNIISFDAKQWKVDDYLEAVILGDIPLPRNNPVMAIYSSGRKILLIPREFIGIAEKFRKISSSKLPPEMKEKLCLELITQMKGGDNGE